MLLPSAAVCVASTKMKSPDVLTSLLSLGNALVLADSHLGVVKKKPADMIKLLFKRPLFPSARTIWAMLRATTERNYKRRMFSYSATTYLHKQGVQEKRPKIAGPLPL